MKDKITLTRGTVTLTLEPFGQGWCLSVSKLIGESLSMYGDLLRREKIQMGLFTDYESAQTSFEKGTKVLTGAEFHFEDVCENCFGSTMIEEITYQR